MGVLDRRSDEPCPAQCGRHLTTPKLCKLDKVMSLRRKCPGAAGSRLWQHVAWCRDGAVSK
jgi:hypothetical protein